MKTGCGCGCLTVVLVCLVAAGAVWFGQGLFDRPAATFEVGTPAEGHRAQQKVFELASGITSRRDPRGAVTLSERELNALLTRHLDAELPLADGGVHLVGDGVVEIAGRLPLHSLLGDSVSSLARMLPARWAGQPVWLRVRGHVRLESGAARGDVRRLRLDPEAVWLGSRRAPTIVLALLPAGPVARATRWPAPAWIEAVVIEPGRLTIVRRP